ncbi:Cation diffusion facilitator family transporter [Trichostrongylus colubriformis]|uniref:Cation diffusion facilitator family transporter n=1 Tax=Trichostrongylus colubriformis TaxID=6319 RepID=A0AAN8FJS4_TRICO
MPFSRMSTVPEQDEVVQKIILPEPSSCNGTPTPSRRPLDPPPQKPTAVGDCTKPKSTTTNHDTRFGLLDNEEEERLLGDSTKPLPFIDISARAKAGRSPAAGARHAFTAPSLRSVSSPSGPSPQDSASLSHASSVAVVHPYHTGSSARIPLTQNELRKPKKEVSQYYKKQNELLENFKNDSEQIQVFQKARTRQRLISSTSTEGDVAQKDEGDEMNRTSSHKGSKVSSNNLSCSADTTAPLLRNTDGEDLEIGNKKANERLLEVDKDDRKPSISSDMSILAKHDAALDAARESSKAASRLAHVTLIVNISLMLAKAVASYLSGSLSILSSLVDSCVDITSGLVISISTRMIKKRDPYLYPRGRTRLEPLSLIIISVVMGVASVQLIFGAFSRIAAAYQFHAYGIGEEPMLDVSLTSASIMVATVIVKFTLFSICQKYKSDPSIAVLAMDHRNDCLSNTVALACAWLGNLYWYYLDPIGAILVSIYILYTWVSTGWDHLSKLSGKSAKPEFINRIIKVCIDHDPRISHLDTVYVYHFGTKFLVEVHIVLDENMPLKVAHDISESLQINIESLPEVERAFVHTDYEYDHQPQDEHKIV